MVVLFTTYERHLERLGTLQGEGACNHLSSVFELGLEVVSQFWSY